MPPASDLTLDVVVPVFSGRARVAPALAALERELLPDDRLIVVDDAGPDGTGDWVRAHVPRAQVHTRSANGGFAACSNDGLRRATAPLVALVNDDCVVGAGWRAAVVGAAAAHPQAGSVASRVLAARTPGLLDSAGIELVPSRGFVQRGQGRPAAAHDRPGPVLGASGACAVYRRAALEVVGLLDESLESYYEDVDLALRLDAAGWPCWYEPAALAEHEGGASFGHFSERHVRLWVRNELLVLLRLPRRRLAVALPGLLVHEVSLALQLVLRHRRGRAWLAGLAEARRTARAGA